MNTREINRGEDKVLPITVRQKSSGDAEDLTTLSASEFKIVGETTDIIKTLAGGGIVVTDAVKGKLNVILDEADTLALKVGNNQDFKLTLNFGADTKIKHVKRVLNVIDED